jgi:L-amino acid N-acyltransferase YncA
MSAEIKRLTIDYFDDILRIWDIAGLPIKPRGRESREQFAVEIASPHCAVYGLFENDRMLAVGIANWDGRRGWVNRVAVDPDRRGEGLAGVIIRECESFLRSCGAHVICALIEDINYPSISCFQKEGFRALEHIRYFVRYDSPDS